MDSVRGVISSTAAALYGMGAVRPIKAIVPNAERVISPETDTYEPSSASAPTPSVTYGRTGRC